MGLKKYGLTEYESKVYIALVKQGLSSAYEISKKSTVPYGKIYPVLASLEEKKFIRKLSGKPQRFVALDPKLVIEEQVRKKEQELLMFKQQSEKSIKELGSLSQKKYEEPLENIRIIEGYKNYLNLSVELHKKAKKCWCSISELSTYKPHIDAYKDCIKRGIKVKMLVSIPEATPDKIKLWKKVGIELRGVQLQPTKFSIIDNESVTLRLTRQKKYISLWIQNPALAEIMNGYFQTLWVNAKPL
ncbi:MAG: hypothetical protein KJ939_02765 [Nanoarchaeota archaeon]|nr:hypothetical protein [Nanoarchaeota archaeon]MBU4351981.1 hypothetical protein [Nanoarchaeota archaeon]